MEVSSPWRPITASTTTATGRENSLEEPAAEGGGVFKVECPSVCLFVDVSLIADRLELLNGRSQRLDYT